ncbi:MAG: hypothetical protein ACKVPY_04565 [Paracoccaceae bacterium]
MTVLQHAFLLALSLAVGAGLIALSLFADWNGIGTLTTVGIMAGLTALAMLAAPPGSRSQRRRH